MCAPGNRDTYGQVFGREPSQRTVARGWPTSMQITVNGAKCEDVLVRLPATARDIFLPLRFAPRLRCFGESSPCGVFSRRGCRRGRWGQAYKQLVVRGGVQRITGIGTSCKSHKASAPDPCGSAGRRQSRTMYRWYVSDSMYGGFALGIATKRLHVAVDARSRPSSRGLKRLETTKPELSGWLSWIVVRVSTSRRGSRSDEALQTLKKG